MTYLMAVLRGLRDQGGSDAAVHVEKVAVAADAVAPGRFRWRLYPQHINLVIVGKALRDAKALGLTSGNSAVGWRLTEAGASAASANDAPLTRPKRDRTVDPWAARERDRLMEEPAYAKVRDGAQDTVTEREALRFFRLDDYIVGSVRAARIHRMVQAFGKDSELGRIVRFLAERVPA